MSQVNGYQPRKRKDYSVPVVDVVSKSTVDTVRMDLKQVESMIDYQIEDLKSLVRFYGGINFIVNIGLWVVCVSHIMGW